MDTLGALALATEPPTDELMKRQPVGRRLEFSFRKLGYFFILAYKLVNYFRFGSLVSIVILFI